MRCLRHPIHLAGIMEPVPETEQRHGGVGGKTGGAIWAAFLFALALAIFTAFSYAELVTKYP